MKDLNLSLANAELTVAVSYRNPKVQEADFTAMLFKDGKQIAEQEFCEVIDGTELVDWLEEQEVQFAFENQPSYIDWLVLNTITTNEFSSYEEAANFWISQ